MTRRQGASKRMTIAVEQWAQTPESELRENLRRAEQECETASRLCQELLGCADLTTSQQRYRELERAMAQLVQANQRHARALAELGDFLLDRAALSE